MNNESGNFVVKDENNEVVKPYKLLRYAIAFAEKNGYAVFDENDELIEDFRKVINEAQDTVIETAEDIVKKASEVVKKAADDIEEKIKDAAVDAIEDAQDKLDCDCEKKHDKNCSSDDTNGNPKECHCDVCHCKKGFIRRILEVIKKFFM